jgi:hypothetical protein
VIRDFEKANHGKAATFVALGEPENSSVISEPERSTL